MRTGALDKVTVARRLLGCSLDLFLREQDPVSVHCLAIAGGEIAEWLAEKAGGAPFRNLILETLPDMKIGKLRQIQRQYSSAFKHASSRDGMERDDEVVLATFDSSLNDATLFIG